MRRRRGNPQPEAGEVNAVLDFYRSAAEADRKAKAEREAAEADALKRRLQLEREREETDEP